MTNFLACGLLVVGIASTLCADDSLPPFKITTKRVDDRVDVQTETDKVVLSVYSPFGISNAVIKRTNEKWPDAMVLRLHLKGLEYFQITDGKVTLKGSISLQDGKPVMRLWKDGREDVLLDAKSPHWMDVRILDGDGKLVKEIPLKNGYFEMALPKTFLAGNPASITVSWIDFYRN
jgi:hypothetical protein